MDLNKLVRYLSSLSGAEKFLGFVQYFSHLLSTLSKNAETKRRLAGLSSPIGDSRMLFRFVGLLQMAQWIIQFESKESASGHPLRATNPRLLWLNRLENLVNCCYYPLEHVYWLAAHKIITMETSTMNAVGMWSCRFWAAYVFLNYLHLWETYKQDKRDESAYKRNNNGKPDPSAREKRHVLLVNLLSNIGYTPLTVHWSLESSPISETTIGLFGSVALACQNYLTWRNC